MTRNYRVTLDFFMEYTCVQCGKRFVANAPNKVSRLYCSKKCQSAYFRSHGHGYNQKMPDDRVCPSCGSAFKASAGKHYGQFCSTGCYQKGWHKKHPEKHAILLQDMKDWRKAHPKYDVDYRTRALRVIGGGTLKCAHCGCDKLRVLEIEHINGGGSKEHRSRGAHSFYASIINGTRRTDDLTILCKVCNQLAYVERHFNIKGHVVSWQ